MSRQAEIEEFTVTHAKHILFANGPQPFARLYEHVAKDVMRLFSRSKSFSRRDVVRRSLDAAISGGALLLSLEHGVGEQRPRKRNVALGDGALNGEATA